MRFVLLYVNYHISFNASTIPSDIASEKGEEALRFIKILFMNFIISFIFFIVFCYKNFHVRKACSLPFQDASIFISAHAPGNSLG